MQRGAALGADRQLPVKPFPHPKPNSFPFVFLTMGDSSAPLLGHEAEDRVWDRAETGSWAPGGFVDVQELLRERPDDALEGCVVGERASSGGGDGVEADARERLRPGRVKSSG